MPAKKVIHKQTILNEAFALVQENGIDALNMRSLAKRCKCSTQPIYLSYKGLDELKKDIFQKLIERFDKCIEDEIALKKYPEYKAVGMGYIRFAKEEKELFKLLMFNNLPSEDLDWQKLSFKASIQMIIKNYGYNADKAQRLHAELWVFVHGIACMYANNLIDWDIELVSQMVSDAYFGLSMRL